MRPLPHPSWLAATVGAAIVTPLVLVGPFIATATRRPLTVDVILTLSIPRVARQAIRGFDDAGLAILGMLGA